MSSSMSVEEKFEALMKSYQTISASNQELLQQNEYLKKELRKSMKQKWRILESSTGSNLNEVRLKANTLNMKETPNLEEL